MEVFDIPAVAAIAQRAGALTVVDATFASPVNQNPLGLGADLVIHSTTKHLGGHDDLTGGVVIGPARDEPARAQVEGHRGEDPDRHEPVQRGELPDDSGWLRPGGRTGAGHARTAETVGPMLAPPDQS